MKKHSLVAIGAVLVAGVLIAGYFLLRADPGATFDERLQIALEGVQSPHTYEMQVETATSLSDRSMVVLGLYRLDFDTNRFGTYATTTLTIPSERPAAQKHSFTFHNLSIGSNLFVKIDTDSALLEKTIPHSPNWHRFSANAIPKMFTDIAVSGPVLDNLALLSGRGKYLTVSGEPTEQSLAGEQFHVYEFILSNKAASVSGGTLEPLIRRIGKGHVFLWVDDVPSVRMMAFSGENYSSTTTVLSVNSPVEITAPSATE